MKRIAFVLGLLAAIFAVDGLRSQTPEPLQSVYSTAALRALDLAAAPFGVERLSVSGVSGDASPVKFMPDVGHVCSIDDGGHCVAAHGNGFWVMMPAHSCVIDLIQYGAVGDGVTDNTTAIQAAMNSVQLCHNGTLVVPPQIFPTHTLTINGPIKIQGSNTAEGSNSQFTNLGANTDLFDIAAGVAAVEINDLDLSMGTASSNSSGWAINASSSTPHMDLMFNDLTITGACGGIIADVNRMTISNSVIFAGGGASCDGIYLGDKTTAANTVEVRLIHNWIIGTGTATLGVGGAGIHIADGGDIMLDHNSELFMTNGLAVTPGAGQDADLHGTGNLFAANNGTGILLQPAASSGVIQRTRLIETWQSNGSSGTRFGAVPNAAGVLVNPNGGTIEDVSFNAGQILGNSAGDILIDGGTNISFLNFQNICGVFGVSGGSAPAIELATNVSDVSIQNDHITQNCDGSVYTKQNFGIQFDGSNNNVLITGNTISGQSTAPTSGVPASGVSSNNIGLDDQALTQTIASSIAPGMFHTILLTGTAATIQTIGSCWYNNKIDIINNGNATYSTVGGNIASLITATPVANTITRGICNSSNKWVLN